MCNTKVSNLREKKQHIRNRNHKLMMKHCEKYTFLIPDFLVKEYIATLKFERCD